LRAKLALGRRIDHNGDVSVGGIVGVDAQLDGLAIRAGGEQPCRIVEIHDGPVRVAVVTSAKWQ